MKRYGNLWGRLVSMENLRSAAAKSVKGKLKKRSVQLYKANEEALLARLQRMLVDKTFVTSHYAIKKIFEPKERDIFILPFYPDRIVHHAVMNIAEPIFESLFIHDSYACRVGKGTHRGSDRTMQLVRRYKYALKCDISKFYPSVRHDIIKQILRRKIKDAGVLWLFDAIIDSVAGGKNLPIGNYCSQWLGNLYLTELDKFVKEKLKFKGYIRYCDDFALFSDSKRELREVRDTLREWLWRQLGLIFSKCNIIDLKREGLDFLGYRHYADVRLLRKKTMKNTIRRLLKLPGLFKAGKISEEHLRSSIASSKGYFAYASTTKIDRLPAFGLKF